MSSQSEKLAFIGPGYATEARAALTQLLIEVLPKGLEKFFFTTSGTEANEAAFNKVRADKKREATNGHDGTWVAHPGLVPVAKAVFDKMMREPNQIPRQRQNVNVTAADLLQVPSGPITERCKVRMLVGGLLAFATTVLAQSSV